MTIAKSLIVAVATLALASCSIFQRQPGAPVDLAALADDVETTRALVMSFAPTATPSTQETLAKLSSAALTVERTLLAASAGGPISDVRGAAKAALDLANDIVFQLHASGKDTGNLAFYVGIASAGFELLWQGQEGAAARELALVDGHPVDEPEDRSK